MLFIDCTFELRDHDLEAHRICLFPDGGYGLDILIDVGINWIISVGTNKHHVSQVHADSKTYWLSIGLDWIDI
jgi:hypothetical protein